VLLRLLRYLHAGSISIGATQAPLDVYRTIGAFQNVSGKTSKTYDKWDCDTRRRIEACDTFATVSSIDLNRMRHAASQPARRGLRFVLRNPAPVDAQPAAEGDERIGRRATARHRWRHSRGVPAAVRTGAATERNERIRGRAAR
jgi:hypothetical protein